MQWWSLLALADLFVINRPHTLQRPKESRSATVASNGVHITGEGCSYTLTLDKDNEDRDGVEEEWLFRSVEAV